MDVSFISRILRIVTHRRLPPQRRRHRDFRPRRPRSTRAPFREVLLRPFIWFSFLFVTPEFWPATQGSGEAVKGASSRPNSGFGTIRSGRGCALGSRGYRKRATAVRSTGAPGVLGVRGRRCKVYRGAAYRVSGTPHGALLFWLRERVFFHSV